LEGLLEISYGKGKNSGSFPSSVSVASHAAASWFSHQQFLSFPHTPLAGCLNLGKSSDLTTP
jgi:hypothetical protein